MTVIKSKPKTKSRATEGFIIVGSVFLVILFLKNSTLAGAEVTSALKTCALMLIPSLFPLTVASEIATETGAAEFVTRKLCTPISKILGVSKFAAVPYFLGLLGGYTSSCKSAVSLYKSGKISHSDCERVIALSNIPSLAFLTGFVGGKIFSNTTVGWILWGIAVISTLIIGVISQILFDKNASSFSKFESDMTPQSTYSQRKKSFSQIVVGAITQSAYSMLIVCACVVFFSVLIAVLKFTLTHLGLSNTQGELLLGTLEITRAVNSCLLIENSIMRATLCAAYIGWSGLCVHFQVFALCEEANISFKKYILLKALQGIICALLALVIFTLI